MNSFALALALGLPAPSNVGPTKQPETSVHDLHATKILRLSQDLPLIIEIVDTEGASKAFLPIPNSMTGSGLVALEKAQAPQHGADMKHLPA